MRTFPLLVALLVSTPAHDASAQEQKQPERPFVVEQTYWVKPGKERQFVSLYRRTELPRLQREKQAGRILWIRLSEPVFSSNNEQWDLRVTVSWESSSAAMAFSERSPSDGVPANENQRESIEDAMRRDLVDNHSDVLVLEQSP